LELLLLEEDWKFGPASHAISDVMAEYPEDFSYSNYTEDGFYVAFAGAAPPDALVTLAAAGFPFEVRENVGNSLNQMLEETARLADKLKELTGGTVGFSVSPVPEEGVFVIHTSASDEQSLNRSTATPHVMKVEDAVNSLVTESGFGVRIILGDGAPTAMSAAGTVGLGRST
jgi:quinol monooxygenase YgiN